MYETIRKELVVLCIFCCAEVCRLTEAPTTTESPVARLRSSQERFFRWHPSHYDPKDIESVRNSDLLVNIALSATFHYGEKEAKQANEFFNEMLLWRKSMDIPNLKITDFPSEMFETGESSIVGKDKSGNAIFWVILKNLVVCPEIEMLAKKAICYLHETLLHEGSGRFEIVLDLEEAGWGNVDTQRMRYIAGVVHRYYHGQLHRVIILNMPSLFRPLVTLIKSITNFDENGLVILDHKRELSKYFAKKLIPKYVGGSNKVDFRKPPPGTVSYKQRLPSFVNKTDFEKFLKRVEHLRKKE